jgi:hypothetical protein
MFTKYNVVGVGQRRGAPDSWCEPHEGRIRGHSGAGDHVGPLELNFVMRHRQDEGVDGWQLEVGS